MSVRRGKSRQIFNFTKEGAFGYFSTDITVPIEYMLTTFSVEELSKLSYARETQTTLNFELLMQRDIDEERAIAEISEYISPDNDRPRKDDIVFLPPLLASVVPVDSNSDLGTYYPNLVCAKKSDDFGEIYERSWGELFRVTHYDMEKGYPITIASEGESAKEVLIDPSKVTMDLCLAGEGESGAKLIVIDGQHRLFALKHLKKTCPERINRILLPVCILYSPESTLENRADHIPPVPKVLRDLFVDVNSTVEKVSGHFVILLSDRTLSGAICRALCDEVMTRDDLGREALSLIEWNTKSYKESLTISKPYTITSLGIIDAVFKEVFSKRKNLPLLKYMINLAEIEDELDFGLDEDDTSLAMPDDFPWRDFRYQNKSYLEQNIRKYFVPALIKLFFESKPYKTHFDIFKRIFDKELMQLSTTRKPEANHASVVISYFLNYSPILENNHSAKALRTNFLDSVEAATKNQYPKIIRNNVFQKGLLLAWLEFLSECRKANVSVYTGTEAFIHLFELVMSEGVGAFENDSEHLYLQDAIYSGVKIRPTKEARVQIQRLILSFMGDIKRCERLLSPIREEIPEGAFMQLKEKLVRTGQNCSAYYLDVLRKSKRKTFVAQFPSDLSLTGDERQALTIAKKNQEDARQAKKNDPSVEIPNEFDLLVDNHISWDCDRAIAQLSSILGYQVVAEEEAEDDSEE